MLIDYKNGQTSVILRVKILDSSVSTGAGKTGLTNATAGLKISTIADNESSPTSYTSGGSTIDTISTLGTFATPTASHCRFGEVSSSSHPGVYEIQIDNTRYAVSSAKSLLVSITGASNAADCDVVIPLRSVDPYDGNRFGLAVLPASAVPGAANGLVIAGNNAATTFTTLTISSGLASNGGTTLTNASGDGLTITSTGSNGNGMTVAGNGSGSGAKWTGGATGIGFYVNGGGTSGAGFVINTTSGDGFQSLPAGGHGMNVAGQGTSKHGFFTTGGTGGTSDGFKAVAGTGGVDIRGNLTGNITGNLSGSAGSVTGAVGSVTGNVGGNVVGSTASVTGAVGSVTGNVGGNVTGSVGSVAGNVSGSVGSVAGNVSGSVGSIANGGIGSSSFAAGAINNAALAADTGLKSVRDGTAQAGGSATITLDSGASVSDNNYRGLRVVTTGGTGAGQSRVITGYVGSTKVATVDYAWEVNPDSSTTFALMPVGDVGRNASMQARANVVSWGGLGGTFLLDSNNGYPATGMASVFDQAQNDWFNVPNNFYASGWSAGGHLLNVDTLTTYTGNTPQTGDAYAIVNNGTFGNSALHTQIGTPQQTSGKYPATLAAADCTGNLPANALAINGNTTAASNLAASASAIHVGSVTGSPSTTTFIDSALPFTTTDQVKGRILILTSGTLIKEATAITAYNPSTKQLTFSSLSGTPSTSDTYVIL